MRDLIQPWTDSSSPIAVSAIIAVILTASCLIGCNAKDEPLEAVQLTAFPGYESHADISPDGTRVAFSHAPEGSVNVSIWLIELDGGEAEQLTDAEGLDVGATWSPDGRRLIFGRYQGRECTIVERSLEEGVERELGSCGKNATGDFDWSPDGEWLAYSDRESDRDPFAIHLLNLISGERHQPIAPEPRSWGDGSPSFSPDGRQIAFTRSVGMEIQDVWRIPVEGGSPIAVTRDASSIHGHCWEPEGDAIVVSSRRSGSRGLWRIPLDDGSPRWLPLDQRHPWEPSQTAVGPLVFEERSRKSSITRLMIEGDAPAKGMLLTSAEVLDPQYSLDGQKVAFVSDQSGFFEIWVREPEGEPTQRTTLASSFSGNPRWSPDGTLLVFDSRTDGQADIYLLDATVVDAQPQRITSRPAQDLAPSFSADGTKIYFGSNDEGVWNIWSVDAAGGEPVQVTGNGGHTAFESSDGSRLYYTKDGAAGIFERSADDGSERLVPGSENLIGHEVWELSGDRLYLIVNEGRLRLVRIDADYTREVVGRSVPPRLLAGLSVDPDASHVLLSAITGGESDLWTIGR